MAESQTSINIPQIIAVAIVGFIAIRWFLNKSSSSSDTSGSSSSSSRGGRQVDVNKINQISTMFPQLDRRTIAWDLQRNGGSVAATTERVLTGRGLEHPPPSFQPNIPAENAGTSGAGSSAAGARKAVASQPDLITRYNLQSRVGGKGKEPVPSEEQEQKRNAWSSDKVSRAENLRRRREEMVLAARRKMEAKEAEGA